MNKDLRRKIAKRVLHTVTSKGLKRRNRVSWYGITIREQNKCLECRLTEPLYVHGNFNEYPDGTWALLVCAMTNAILSSIHRCHKLPEDDVLNYIDEIDELDSHTLAERLVPEATLKGSSLFINALRSKYGAFSLSHIERNKLSLELQLIVAASKPVKSFKTNSLV